MIYFNFNIRNPKWWNRFENIKCWTGATPFENKFWEVELTKDSELLRFEFEFTTRQDHAGLRLELGLAGYTLRFNLYDNRHWNTDTNSWMKHD